MTAATSDAAIAELEQVAAGLRKCAAEIAARENMTINEVCTRVRRSHQGTGLTSAVRILLISYFRAKAGTSIVASFDELLGTQRSREASATFHHTLVTELFS